MAGNNPWTALPVTLFCILQTAAAAACGLYNVSWLNTFLLSWVFGSLGAGHLMAAHHEISHYLVFKKVSWNKAFWIFANCPLAIPLGTLFKQYHVDHHTDMGAENVDTGIWTATEAKLLENGNWFSRVIFLIFFPIGFFFRPFFMMVQKPMEMTDLVSWIVIPIYDVVLCYYSGYSLKPFLFLVGSLYHGVGLHPIAGHCISEHVMLGADGQETHSCYDKWLNPLLLNFGYHVEHHDFPNIPWNRLPQIRKIAPEYYEHLKSYDSWTMVMWQFITDRSVGYNGIMTKRVKRTGGGEAPKRMKPFTPAEKMPLTKSLLLRGILTTAGVS